MTSKEWIELNPEVDKEVIVNELIEWRQRAETYKKQLLRIQEQVADLRRIANAKR